jgi:hypothetical protein
LTLPLVPISILVEYDEEIKRLIPAVDEHFVIDPGDPLYGPPLRYFLLFEKWPSLIVATSSLTPETVFYNKYYWFLKLIRLWQHRNGYDAGMEQQASMLLESGSEDRRFTLDGTILEQIEQRVSNEINPSTP